MWRKVMDGRNKPVKYVGLSRGGEVVYRIEYEHGSPVVKEDVQILGYFISDRDVNTTEVKLVEEYLAKKNKVLNLIEEAVQTEVPCEVKTDTSKTTVNESEIAEEIFNNLCKNYRLKQVVQIIEILNNKI